MHSHDHQPWRELRKAKAFWNNQHRWLFSLYKKVTAATFVAAVGFV